MRTGLYQDGRAFIACLLSIFLSCLQVACTRQEPVSTAGSTINTEDSSTLELRALSTQPWLVTGGDLLIELQARDPMPAGTPSLRLNGQPLPVELVSIDSGRWLAMLQGLPAGDSEIEANLQDGADSANLMISNYPITGPIISGPHESPFHCQTEEFELVTGEALGPASDSNCGIAASIDYVYWSETEAGFRALADASGESFPDDVAYLPGAGGEGLPYIVRVETGTVNRAIYEIAMLHVPGEPEPGPFDRNPRWNGKLVYTHGGGCRSGWYQQGSRTGGVMRDGLLRQGYALVSASLNVFGQNCNDLLASETHIMVKERFIEHYGVPDYTIATGASGGSYQSHQTADNYPGVFDGIIVAASFPDVTSATIFTLADSRLLHHYFSAVNPDAFSREQQRAVAGFGSWGSIANLARGAARLDPLYEPDVPAEEQGGEVSNAALESRRYGLNNRGGVRATVYDHTRNVYGSIDGTGTAQRPLDNRGIQYGLRALNQGLISVPQFLDLNRRIGGFDHDMNHVAQRHGADPRARRRALESGRILYGGAGLATTPIIDYRNYTDHAEGGDIHMIVHQFSTRQRLVNANGHADNHVMQIGGRWGFTASEPDLGVLFQAMDEWITAIAADTSTIDAAIKVVRNKPAALMDACWDNSGDERVKLQQPQTYMGASDCNRLFPAYSTPRHEAGAPLANDIVSCSLRPLSESDYAVQFTREEWIELQEIFADGVCDWSQPDVSRTSHQGVWASFGPSPVNRLY